MTKLMNGILADSSDSLEVASILNKLIWASWVTYFFVIITGLFFNDWTLIIVTMTGSVLLVPPFIFIRRGYVQICSLIVVVVILGTVTFIAMVGQGIRDLAILTFPIILIFAGLTLKHVFYRICVGLALVATSGLVIGEINGWFITKPYFGEASTWFYLFGVSIILLVAALAVDLLVKNFRRTLKTSQQEVSERKRVETQNRIITEVQEVLLHPFNLEDAYQLVSEKVKELIGDCITVISILDASSGKLSVNSIEGLDTPLEKLLPILGFDPREKEFSLDEITEEDFLYYRSGKLETMEGGLYAFTTHLVSQTTCLVVEKLLRIKKIYTMGFIHNKEFLGSLAILARGDISPFIGTVEQIMNLAIIAIERKRAEDEVEKNEKRFHAMIEHGRDNISLLAADGTLLWENPSANSTLGYGFNQHIGQSIFELIHPEEQEKVIELFAYVRQSPGNFIESESRLMHADGNWRWIECSAINLLDDPNVQAIVLNYRDITKRKMAEEALHNALQRQDSILEGTYAGTWEWNIQTGETVFNEKWAQLIGYTLDELAPVSIKTWETFTNPDDLNRSSNLIERHFAGELPYYECECQMKHKDGHWIWVQDRGRLMSRTVDGKPLMMFGTHIDITKRKLAEEAVRESETRYKTLFENSPVALWEEDFSQVVAGVDGIGLQGEQLRQFLENHPDIVISLLSKIVINDVNKATMQLYGYGDRQLLIGNSANLFKNVSHESLVDELMAMSTRQTSYEIIVDNCRADGKVINVRVRWSVYPGFEVDMSRVIVNTADITQQIQAISVQSAIYRISQAASATENLQELYISIHQILGELMPAKNFYIALYDGNEGMISFPYHVDEMDPQPKPRKFGNGWTEYVIRTGQPVLLSPENLDKLEEDEGVRTVGSDSIDWLGVPLKVEDRIIGMVAVQTYTEGIRYTEVEKDILVFVSNQIAMAIDRKRIEETLKYSSTHEPLTGLYNRGYYEEEIKRLSSGRQFPVGVIMMDVDGLKVINDKYGHAAGDELLKSFASVLQKEFRSEDVVARIGGDEFSVLLPLSPMKIVKKAVERTQKSVDAFNVLNPKIRLSYSVGYFTTESGDSVLDAIKHADALMYHDKTSKKAARLL
jgi:diguanylate cyclase (GGDEF)-like protein/PAS domain S-box-containing protein